MIKEISKEDLYECADVIKESFSSVAEEFNITEQNVPRYVAFSTTGKKLSEQYDNGRKMFAYFNGCKIVGFYSLEFDGNECELNNLCVLPDYRHKGIGDKLIEHSFNTAQKNNCTKMNISIVEENQLLKKWYIDYGFVPLYTKKYDFFPFTCGYMRKEL